MKLPRRHILRLAAGLATLPAATGFAAAQSYPSHAARLIVGFPPGGLGDVLARLIGQWLTENLGQAFVIENRPGAGTNIATEVVVKAAPDGYTLLWVTSSNAINATLYDSLNFNFIRDIAPVASVGANPYAVVVSPSFPAQTIAEFIAYAKANPGKLSMASSGVGALSHVAGEMFKIMTGIDMLHVPYRGSALALTDLIGGRVQVMFTPITSAIEQIRTGKLRPLAVTSATQLDVLPGIPTVSATVPGYEVREWTGVGAPKNTPPAIVDALNKAINAGLADPQMMSRLASLGAVPMPMTSAEFKTFVTDETEKWGKVIKQAGIKSN
jgi:tripartite-type tricarboxylate transporter receptor subunit TctC